ncbi:hypothetical protein C8Q72DRAFT_821963 [Fomitopsis betulina]|nr:hypothetical protein C8Q72DRAFT_821963 [Fomitopsis betulina]
MPPRASVPCQICTATESKYTCAQCSILYCSIPCYKTHKASSCHKHSASHDRQLDSGGQQGTQHATPLGEPSSVVDAPNINVSEQDGSLPDADKGTPLRPLTSLRWPYVPEESAYPDPLKRDDPKPVQLHQYEAIATSPAIRRTLAAHPELPSLLRRLDALRGPAREAELERALGVSADHAGTMARNMDDQRALRELAEVVEAAVRGGREGMLGLDWGD